MQPANTVLKFKKYILPLRWTFHTRNLVEIGGQKETPSWSLTKQINT